MCRYCNSLCFCFLALAGEPLEPLGYFSNCAAERSRLDYDNTKIGNSQSLLATRNEKFWFVFAAAARLEDFKIFLRFLTTTVTSTWILQYYEKNGRYEAVKRNKNKIRVFEKLTIGLIVDKINKTLKLRGICKCSIINILFLFPLDCAGFRLRFFFILFHER